MEKKVQGNTENFRVTDSLTEPGRVAIWISADIDPYYPLVRISPEEAEQLAGFLLAAAMQAREKENA